MLKRKEPRVSLRKMEIPEDFIIGRRRDDDARDNKTVRSRFGRKIELPKRYAKDFEVEI